MNIEVDKIAVDIDVIVPDAVVVEASAVAPSGIVTEAVAELPTQVIVISHEEIPTISPLEIVDYGSSLIECAFDVSTEQAEEVVKGVLCGTVNPPTFDNADYRLLHGQGNMDLVIAGLHTNTEYYLRPYALSNLGCKYGDVVAQRTKASPIPDEYQLVEYLESDGSGQYIDTLYIPQVDSEIIAKMAITSTSGQNVSGITYGSSAGWFNFGYVPGLDHNKLLLRWFTTNTSISGPYVDLDFHIYERTNSYQKIDGVTYSNISLTSVPSSLSFYLFYVHVNYIPLPNVATYKQKFAYFKIKLAGEEIKSMYPVYRKSDSKPGMYDTVNNVFYTNQGSGEFIVGPDKEWEE